MGAVEEVEGPAGGEVGGGGTAWEGVEGAEVVTATVSAAGEDGERAIVKTERSEAALAAGGVAEAGAGGEGVVHRKSMGLGTGRGPASVVAAGAAAAVATAMAAAAAATSHGEDSAVEDEGVAAAVSGAPVCRKLPRSRPLYLPGGRAATAGMGTARAALATTVAAAVVVAQAILTGSLTAAPDGMQASGMTVMEAVAAGAAVSGSAPPAAVAAVVAAVAVAGGLASAAGREKSEARAGGRGNARRGPSAELPPCFRAQCRNQKEGGLKTTTRAQTGTAVRHHSIRVGKTMGEWPET